MLYGEPGYGEDNTIELPPSPEEIRIMRLEEKIIEYAKKDMWTEAYEILLEDYFEIESFEKRLPDETFEKLKNMILVVRNNPY